MWELFIEWFRNDGIWQLIDFLIRAISVLIAIIIFLIILGLSFVCLWITALFAVQPRDFWEYMGEMYSNINPDALYTPIVASGAAIAPLRQEALVAPTVPPELIETAEATSVPVPR